MCFLHIFSRPQINNLALKRHKYDSKNRFHLAAKSLIFSYKCYLIFGGLNLKILLHFYSKRPQFYSSTFDSTIWTHQNFYDPNSFFIFDDFFEEFTILSIILFILIYFCTRYFSKIVNYLIFIYQSVQNLISALRSLKKNLICKKWWFFIKSTLF